MAAAVLGAEREVMVTAAAGAEEEEQPLGEWQVAGKMAEPEKEELWRSL